MLNGTGVYNCRKHLAMCIWTVFFPYLKNISKIPKMLNTWKIIQFIVHTIQAYVGTLWNAGENSLTTGL